MGATIVRFYAMHEPLKAMFYFECTVLAFGAFRNHALHVFLLYYTMVDSNRHLQSLFLAGVSIILAFLIMLFRFDCQPN